MSLDALGDWELNTLILILQAGVSMNIVCIADLLSSKFEENE